MDISYDPQQPKNTVPSGTGVPTPPVLPRASVPPSTPPTPPAPPQPQYAPQVPAAPVPPPAPVVPPAPAASPAAQVPPAMAYPTAPPASTPPSTTLQRVPPTPVEQTAQAPMAAPQANIPPQQAQQAYGWQRRTNTFGATPPTPMVPPQPPVQQTNESAQLYAGTEPRYTAASPQQLQMNQNQAFSQQMQQGQPVQQQYYGQPQNVAMEDVSQLADNLAAAQGTGKQSGKRVLTIILSITGVVILGIGAMAYVGYRSIMSDPLVSMHFAMSDTTSGHFDANLSLSQAMTSEMPMPMPDGTMQTYTERGTSKMEIGYEGLFDASNREHVKLDSIFKVSFEAAMGDELMRDGGEADVMLDGPDALYLRVRILPQMFTEIGLGPIEGRWIKMMPRELETYTNELVFLQPKHFGMSKARALAQAVAASGDEYECEESETEIFGLLADADWTSAATVGNPLDEKPYTAAPHNVEVVRYPITIDLEVVKQNALLVQQERLREGCITKSEAERMLRMYDYYLDHLNIDTFEVWITTDDLLYRFHFAGDYEMDVLKYAEMVDEEDVSEYAGFSLVSDNDFDLDVIGTDYNKRVSIEYPTQTTTFEELMGFQESADVLLELSRHSSTEEIVALYNAEVERLKRFQLIEMSAKAFIPAIVQ